MHFKMRLWKYNPKSTELCCTWRHHFSDRRMLWSEEERWLTRIQPCSVTVWCEWTARRSTNSDRTSDLASNLSCDVIYMIWMVDRMCDPSRWNAVKVPRVDSQLLGDKPTTNTSQHQPTQTHTFRSDYISHKYMIWNQTKNLLTT